MKSCLYCGRRINEDSSYCSWCGANLDQNKQSGVITVLSVIGLFLTYILLFPFFTASLMIFDGPGSGNSIFTKLLFFSILFFPTSCFMVIILSTPADKYARYVPLALNILAFLIGLAGIHFLQGGSFVPR